MSASRVLPYPPLELASRVLCLDRLDNPLRAYDELGAETKASLVALLPEGWSFAGKRVLDFGCGAGRTLRHFLVEAERGEFWGVDIHGPSIEWLRGALCPPLHARRCTPDPPLAFDRESFDLVWAISVFTHLTDSSIPWLLELHRVLKPGGLLIASYMGRWNSELLAGESWDENRIGMNVLRHYQEWDSGGPMVLMSDWWVRAHWGRGFKILYIEPRIHNQSWALLQKRDVELTTEDVARPEDDAREYAAVRHNLIQVQREQVIVIGELRRRYEGSGSWRLTRPLRAIARVLRSVRSRASARARARRHG